MSSCIDFLNIHRGICTHVFYTTGHTFLKKKGKINADEITMK